MRNIQSTLKKAVLTGGAVASVAVMALTGCSNTSERSAGRQWDDRIVNSRVKDALDDATIYKFPQVRAMTYGGVVQLSGFVATEEQKREAAQIASRVGGVREVINNISLMPTATGGATGYSQQEQKSASGAPIREDK